MRNRQKGVTFVGWVLLLIPLAIVGYAGMRLLPVYLNYMKVAKAMEATAGEVKAASTDATAIRNTIDKHFAIDMVDYPTTKDMKITRDGGAWVIESAYDDEAPLFGNISLHVVFDKKVTIRSGGGD